MQSSNTKKSKRYHWIVVVMRAVVVAGGIVILWSGKQEETARFVRSETKLPAVVPVQPATNAEKDPTMADTQETKGSPEENWRGAPVGDGEDSLESYHSYDHRPSGADPRDVLLQQYTIHRCPNDGIGRMVSGQDPRYFDLVGSPQRDLYKERNPKFVCDVHKLAEDPNHPCVVYSFGSWDEISFEVGMGKETNYKCEIHTFDPEKLPTEETAKRNHFTAHDMGITGVDNGKFKRVSTIMSELGHSHLQVLKIDVEGHERESLPALVQDGTLNHVEQLSIEFHSVDLMKQGLDLLVQNGFGIVYARREDRCGWCTEVSLVKLT